MKKLTLILAATTILAYVGCNSEAKKEEQPSMEQAVAEMTKALDTSAVVAPADSAHK